jgi:hypothetical protein
MAATQTARIGNDLGAVSASLFAATRPATRHRRFRVGSRVAQRVAQHNLLLIQELTSTGPLGPLLHEGGPPRLLLNCTRRRSYMNSAASSDARPRAIHCASGVSSIWRSGPSGPIALNLHTHTVLGWATSFSRVAQWPSGVAQASPVSGARRSRAESTCSAARTRAGPSIAGSFGSAVRGSRGSRNRPGEPATEPGQLADECRKPVVDSVSERARASSFPTWWQAGPKDPVTAVGAARSGTKPGWQQHPKSRADSRTDKRPHHGSPPVLAK